MPSIRDLVERNKGRQCIEPGCTRPRHAAASRCNSHHLRFQRYGDGQASAVEQWRLKPFAKTAAAFMRGNVDHPVIKRVCSELQHRLDDANRHMKSLGPNPYIAPMDHRTKLQRELQRLKVGGATGADLFEAALALHLYSKTAFEPASEAYRFALARAVLMVVPLARHESVDFSKGTKRLDATRLSTVMLRAFGRDLAVMLGVQLHLCAKAIEAESTRPKLTRAQAIAAAVERQPFVTT